LSSSFLNRCLHCSFPLQKWKWCYLTRMTCQSCICASFDSPYVLTCDGRPTISTQVLRHSLSYSVPAAVLQHVKFQQFHFLSMQVRPPILDTHLNAKCLQARAANNQAPVSLRHANVHSCHTWNSIFNVTCHLGFQQAGGQHMVTVGISRMRGSVNRSYQPSGLPITPIELRKLLKPPEWADG
jgi:hypothetical protein